MIGKPRGYASHKITGAALLVSLYFECGLAGWEPVSR
jgi:hypothetical protein